jgi:thioredoxin reductase (NADPH)
LLIKKFGKNFGILSQFDGGPAGASAAVYAPRGQMEILVIDKAPASGKLAITHKIANYPGVREELTGQALLTRIQNAAPSEGFRYYVTF